METRKPNRQLEKFETISSDRGTRSLSRACLHFVTCRSNKLVILYNRKIGWSEKMIGISLAVVGLTFAIVQGGLIRVIIPKLGQTRSVYVGLGLNALGFVLFAFAYESWMMFAVTVVYCLGAIAGPALQGIISTVVPANEQGELQGALTSLMSVTSIVGPVVMTNTFAFFTEEGTVLYFPGAPMLLGAVLSIVATILARRTLKRTVGKVNSRVTAD